MADRLYTSADADEVLSAIRFETKLEKFILARVAFSLSIIKDGSKVPVSNDFSGAEIKRPTFIGTDEIFIKTILSYVHNETDIQEDRFYSNRSLIKKPYR